SAMVEAAVTVGSTATVGTADAPAGAAVAVAGAVGSTGTTSACRGGVRVMRYAAPALTRESAMPAATTSAGPREAPAGARGACAGRLFEPASAVPTPLPERMVAPSGDTEPEVVRASFSGVDTAATGACATGKPTMSASSVLDGWDESGASNA